MTVFRISRAAVLGALVLSLMAWATPALAQTGQLKGKVVDAQNTPIRDAKITMVAVETNRKYETKSDGQGNWRQIGLPPGVYAVTAEKDKMVQTFDVKLGVETKDVNFSLQPGAGKMGDEAKKEAERVAALQAAFAEGATLTNAGKTDEAIAKFNEVLAIHPKCAECYSNIGAIYSRKQDWAKAEEAYKQAIQTRPDMVDAYNGLANVYNAQKKFAEAQAISAEGAKHGAGAAGGATGNADGLYNQGVIAWNGNDFPKAQELFLAAVKANDKHAEAHFMLGQAYLNTGKLPEAAKEFETYIKIAPTGPNAEKAKTNYEMLKQYIK